ncbi:energy transducer TonB [Aurantivibrio infirmus]
MINKVIWPILAASFTAALFLLMSYLITPSGEIPTTDVDNVIVEITRKPRDLILTNEPPPLPEKPSLEKLPPPPPIIRTQPTLDDYKNKYIAEIPTIGVGELPTDAGAGDRHATPIVRIPPQYPPNALERGIEGWVLVEFTISIGGTVEDIVVVDGEPQGVFDREAKRALKRWKYQPKVIDGKAMSQLNMREIFRFEISNS